MTLHILVVCTANMCRSPVAGVLLSEGLDRIGAGSVTTVTTAGTNAVAGTGLCPDAATHILDAADRDRLVATHRARPLTDSLVDRADLVLTAARRQHTFITGTRPAANTRTFTLREAATLAERVADRYASGRLPEAPELPATDRVEDRLRWLVDEMHHGRGHEQLASPPAPVRRRWWQRPVTDEGASLHPYDIPDTHEGGPDVHGETFAVLGAAVDDWLGAAAAVLTVPAR